MLVPEEIRERMPFGELPRLITAAANGAAALYNVPLTTKGLQ